MTAREWAAWAIGVCLCAALVNTRDGRWAWVAVNLVCVLINVAAYAASPSSRRVSS